MANSSGSESVAFELDLEDDCDLDENMSKNNDLEGVEIEFPDDIAIEDLDDVEEDEAGPISEI